MLNENDADFFIQKGATFVNIGTVGESEPIVLLKFSKLKNYISFRYGKVQSIRDTKKFITKFEPFSPDHQGPLYNHNGEFLAIKSNHSQKVASEMNQDSIKIFLYSSRFS